MARKKGNEVNINCLVVFITLAYFVFRWVVKTRGSEGKI